MKFLTIILKFLLELLAECLLELAEWLVIIANSIFQLDYLYIDWIISLISPFFSFAIFLLCLPLIFVAISFGAAFYIFLQKLNKHRANLMVRKCAFKRLLLLVFFLLDFTMNTLKSFKLMLFVLDLLD